MSNDTQKPRRIGPGGTLIEIDVEREKREAEEREKRDAEARRMSADWEKPDPDPQERVAIALEGIRGQLGEIKDLLGLQLAAMDEAAKARDGWIDTLEALRNRVDPPAVP